MSENDFSGFQPSNTTPVPDVLFDKLLSKLSGTELKVLLYVIRRTAGFKKTTDAISLSQFQNGITTKDGRQLDKGCGVKDRKAIIAALKSLEEMKCITSEKAKTDDGDYATTVYRIFFCSEVVENPNQGSSKNPPRVVGKSTLPPSGKNPPRVVVKTHLQETVLQETELQETERQERVAPTSAQKPPTSPQPEPSFSPSLSSKNNNFSSPSSEVSPNEKKTGQVDYELFDELCRKKGYAPTFKVPRNDKNNSAIQELREQGANAEQVEYVFNDIWNDKDPFWRQHRGKPSTVASQFTARVWKMTQPISKRRTVSGLPSFTEDKTVGVSAKVEPEVAASIAKVDPVMPVTLEKPKEISLPVGYTRLKIDKPARPRSLEARRRQEQKDI